MSATVVADLSAHRAPKAAPDAGRETFIRAREIERKLAAGEAVTKDQRIWVEGYRTTPEYLAWTAMVADFGESVLSVG